MMNTGFPSLANELVLQIASDADDASLLSLLLCNRSLNNLLTPMLHTRALAPRGGQSAMQWAAENSHISLVKFLLSRGIHPDSGATITDAPALRAAVLLQRADIVTLLLSHGADVNRQNANGTCYFAPVVHLATEMEDTAMLKLLVAHGADVVSENIMGFYVGTPLHLAVGNGDIDTVKALLEMRVPLDGEDSGRETPLDKAEGLACYDLPWWDDMVLIGEMLVIAGATLRYDEDNVAALKQNGRREGEFQRLMLAVKRDLLRESNEESMEGGREVGTAMY